MGNPAVMRFPTPWWNIWSCCSVCWWILLYVWTCLFPVFFFFLRMKGTQWTPGRDCTSFGIIVLPKAEQRLLLSPSWAIPPLAFCALDNQALSQEVAPPTSALPEGEFKALYSLTENSSGVFYRPEPSCPNNISASCLHGHQGCQTISWSSQGVEVQEFSPQASITFPRTVSSIFPATCTENFIPVFNCWWEIPNFVCNILPCLSPFTQLRITSSPLPKIRNLCLFQGLHHLILAEPSFSHNEAPTPWFPQQPSLACAALSGHIKKQLCVAPFLTRKIQKSS